jgi:hypothetical protein
MSNGEKLRKYLGPAHADQYGHPPEVPAKQHEKYVQELKNKLDNPPFLFNGLPDTVVGTETHQGEQNKGTEQHLTSDKEKIAVMRAWMEKAKANPGDPEVLRQGRKLLEEMKGEKSSEPEQKSSETSRRKLDAPPNLQCLDVSASRIATKGTVPVTDPPGTGYQAILEPYLTNNCGETITNTEFSITSIVSCPDGSSNPQTRTIAGPASINDGQTLENGISEVENGACIEKTNGVPVATIPPTAFSVSMIAIGEDASGRTLSSGISKWKLI